MSLKFGDLNPGPTPLFFKWGNWGLGREEESPQPEAGPGQVPVPISPHPSARGRPAGMTDRLLSPLLSPLPAGSSASTRRPWSCCRPAPATSSSARTGPSASRCSRSPPAAAPRASPARGARSSSLSTLWARTPTWNWPPPRSGPRPTSPYRCVHPALEGPRMPQALTVRSSWGAPHHSAIRDSPQLAGSGPAPSRGPQRQPLTSLPGNSRLHFKPQPFISLGSIPSTTCQALCWTVGIRRWTRQARPSA